MNGLALMRAIDCRTSSSRSLKASAAHSGLMPVSSWIESRNSSSRNVSMPQSVWWMRMISSVPSRRWEIASERISSSVTTPPALRITCASPSVNPSAPAGSSRASMHATTATFFAGGRGSEPLSKREAYASLLATSSSVTLMVASFLEGGGLKGSKPDRVLARAASWHDVAMERVRLELLSEDHIGDFSALVTDAEVLRFTRVPEPPPADFPRRWLDRYVAAREDGSAEAFAAVDPDGRFVGLALAPEIDREAGEVELGYIVHPAARGRGLATEMLPAAHALGARRFGSAPHRAHHQR